MKGKEVFFYGLRDDIKGIIELIDSSFDVKCVKAGLLDEKPRGDHLSNLVTKEIRTVQYPNWVHNERYLIMEKDTEVFIRNVPQRKGGIKYAVDQLKNQNSVIFSLGGLYQDKAIIASGITSTSNTPFSKIFFKSISNFLKQEFRKNDNFYIGKVAMEEVERGVILTTDINLANG